MTGKDKRIYHLFFIVSLICLTIYKWNDFHLPYFWDELGVYTRSIEYQMQHTISLAPASVPPVLSRGHPLLFTCLNAMAWRIFGSDVMAAHFFCFFIAVMLLLAVYLKTGKYFDLRTGLICSSICLIQPLFLAQSGFVLPEITLALFIFLALCSYYEEKFILFALFASLALLTKESAIVLPVVVIFYSLLRWAVTREKPLALTLTNLIITALPYLIFGCFLLIQKQQNGWYFFPYHIDYVSFNMASFTEQYRHFMQFLFKSQGRYVLTAITFAALIFSVLLNKQSITGKRSGFLLLLVLFSLVYLAFNSLFGVYMGRYATVVLVVLCTLSGIIISSLSKSNLYTVLVLSGLSIASMQHLEQTSFNYDEDLGYRKEVAVLQKGIAEMISIAKQGDKLFSNFPGYYALTCDKAGYLNGEKKIPAMVDEKQYNYLLLCNPGSAYQMDNSKYDYTILKTIDDGYAHTILYKAIRK